MKRRALILLIVVLAVQATVFSSTPASSQSPPSPGAERMRQDAVGEVEFTWNRRTGTPSFTRGRIPISVLGLSGPASSRTVAVAVIDRYAALFGIKQVLQELNVVESNIDTLRMSHTTLGQVYQGIKVYGASMQVHLSANGREVMAIGNGFVPDIRLSNIQPRITARQALAVARKALSNGSTRSGPTWMVYPGTGKGLPRASAKLAWLIELRDDAIPARNL